MEKGEVSSPSSSFAIPKVIWTFWAQGWNRAPEVVARCLASWRAHNPEYRVVALDAASLRDGSFLSPEVEAEFAALTAKFGARDEVERDQCLSGVLGAYVLKEHGGIWADATVFCARPLREWLPERAASSGKYYLFLRPLPEGGAGAPRFESLEAMLAPDFPPRAWPCGFKGGNISNWFMAAAPGSEVARQFWEGWRELVELREERGVPLPYFSPHFLYAALYARSASFREEWDAIPFGPAPLLADATHRVQRGLAPLPETPVHKLQWKNGWDRKEVLDGVESAQALFRAAATTTTTTP